MVEVVVEVVVMVAPMAMEDITHTLEVAVEVTTEGGKCIHFMGAVEMKFSSSCEVLQE